MNTASLRLTLQKEGISLTVEGENLRIKWNGKRTEELANLVRIHKAELIASLFGSQNHGRAGLSPELALRAEQAGHCGTCKHWQPVAFKHEGICTLGWSAHEHWNSSTDPVYIHGACECMCEPKRWQTKHRSVRPPQPAARHLGH